MPKRAPRPSRHRSEKTYGSRLGASELLQGLHPMSMPLQLDGQEHQLTTGHDRAFSHSIRHRARAPHDGR